ncbi:MAG: hypothetical protein ACRD40_13815 [Candidatus Acidiferrales bacterium]
MAMFLVERAAAKTNLLKNKTERPVMKSKIITVLSIALALAAAWMTADNWLTAKDAQRQFTNAFADEQNLIVQSDATKQRQENDLKNLLKEIESLKTKTRTPSQVIKELPKYLPLPAPISVATECGGSVKQEHYKAAADVPAVRPDKANNSTRSANFRYPELTPSLVREDAADAKIPVQDLKPLFDFAQDCRACDAELDEAHKTAADDSMKIKALTNERDLAIHAQKGSFWHRMQQDAVWFAFGMAGYAVIRR